jgi:ribonuclease HI
MRSNTLNMFIDGSAVGKGSKNQWVLGWGIVVNHGSAERQGAVWTTPSLKGQHEFLSFVEACIYAQSQGYEPSQVCIYTDDQLLGESNFSFHEGNHRGFIKDQIVERMRSITAELYCEQTFNLVLGYLKNSQIHKVKGHSSMVSQERADYLARHSANQLSGRTAEPLQSFPQWLEAGILYYGIGQVVKRWYAPFAATQDDSAHHESPYFGFSLSTHDLRSLR